MAVDNNNQEVRNLKLKCNKLLDEISRMEQEDIQKQEYIAELEEQNRQLKEKLEEHFKRPSNESLHKDSRLEKKAGGEKMKRFFWKYSGMLLVLGISLGATIVLLTIYFIFLK